MRRAAAVILLVAALAAACAFVMWDDGKSAEEDAAVDAGFSARVSYSVDSVEIELTPKSAGEHVWTVGGEEFVSSGRETVAVSVAYSDEPLAVVHSVSSGESERSMSMSLDVSGAETVVLEWTDSSGVARSLTVELFWREYLELREGPVKDPADVLHSYDPVVDLLSEELSVLWQDLSNDELAAELLLFVQTAFSYQDDFQSAGMAEWVKTPYETVFNIGGDCEDTALLYAMLGRALGLDTVLVEMEGHMAAAVRMDECGGQSYEVDGVVYWYCETATDSPIPVGTDVLQAAFVRIVP